MRNSKWRRRVNIFLILESFYKYLIIDIRRRIEDKKAYLKKEFQYGLEEGLFGKCVVDRPLLGCGPLAVSCGQGHGFLYFIFL
jgi:hypothetical protein